MTSSHTEGFDTPPATHVVPEFPAGIPTDRPAEVIGAGVDAADRFHRAQELLAAWTSEELALPADDVAATYGALLGRPDYDQLSRVSYDAFHELSRHRSYETGRALRLSSLLLQRLFAPEALRQKDEALRIVGSISLGEVEAMTELPPSYEQLVGGDSLAETRLRRICALALKVLTSAGGADVVVAPGSFGQPQIGVYAGDIYDAVDMQP